MGERKNATFKRHEIFRLGTLIEEQLQSVGSAKAYKPGQSDQTVAVEASKALSRELTAEDIRRVRHQTHGKLATEGRASSEIMASLMQTVSQQAIELRKLSDRVRRLEEETEPTPPKGNGYHPPRPTAR